MCKLLKLSHHRHTGKVMARHHTSYPVLLLLLVMTSGLLIIQHSASASPNSLISQTITTAAPLNAAVIITPATGTTVYKSDITVTGTCDFVAPYTVISIYNNGATFLGSAQCQPSGTFSVVITLTPGLNLLTARTNNVGGEYGPVSNEVEVTYIAPPPAVTTDPKKPGSRSSKPKPIDSDSSLVIRSRKPYVTYNLSEPAEWIGSFAGGTPPYTVWVNWGDGSKTVKYNNIGLQEYTFRHQYSEMKPFHMTIRVTDAEGNSRKYTFAAIAPGYTRTMPISLTSPKSFLETFEGFLLGIYGCYLLLIIMFGLVWYDARLVRLKYSPTRFPVLYQPSLPVRQTKKSRR